jgi:hypothetical protein
MTKHTTIGAMNKGKDAMEQTVKANFAAIYNAARTAQAACKYQGEKDDIQTIIERAKDARWLLVRA